VLSSWEIVGGFIGCDYLFKRCRTAKRLHTRCKFAKISGCWAQSIAFLTVRHDGALDGGMVGLGIKSTCGSAVFEEEWGGISDQADGRKQHPYVC